MTKMTWILILCAIFLGVPTTACSAESNIPWTKFVWSPLTSGSRTYAEGALLVPIRIRSETRTYYMQLDTGASGTIFYAVPKSIQRALAGNWHKDQPFSLPIHIGKTTLTFSGLKIVYSPKADMTAQHPIIGTLGQNALFNFVVLIDFPHSRIAFLHPNQLAAADIQGVSFVHMTTRDGKFFIPVSIGNTSYPDDFFYDSGSSIFPLLTTLKVWKRFMGREPNTDHDSVVKANQWGKTATLVGARLPSAMVIGPVRLDSPVTWVQISGGRKSSDLASANYPVKGIVGNAPFAPCCMIVIDAPENRFGIQRTHKDAGIGR